jgi:ParB family chromosome partitioning protein
MSFPEQPSTRQEQTMNIQMIPLNKLVPSPANVRKTGALIGIEELAASIAAHGLLQNLQVRPGDKGKFEVVAGGRRLAALKRLVKGRVIGKTEDISCHVMNGEDASEISLAENIVRLPMHPADQYEAFKALSDQGKGPQEIAARFGCSPAVVKQRLKLANVSFRLIEAYRHGEIDLDQLMAFAVSDDHAAQEQVWAALPQWNHNPDTIRSHLMVANVEAGDRRVQFVGIKAYRKAGGHILRDLFQPEHDGYLTDVAVLDRLVIEKLEAEAAAIRAEGWKWVEIMPAINHDHLRGLGRVYPEREQPTDQQQAEIDALTARYDSLIEEHGDDPPDEIGVELEEISEKIDALSDGAERWMPEDGLCRCRDRHRPRRKAGSRARSCATGGRTRGNTQCAYERGEGRADEPLPCPLGSADRGFDGAPHGGLAHGAGRQCRCRAGGSRACPRAADLLPA